MKSIKIKSYVIFSALGVIVKLVEGLALYVGSTHCIISIVGIISTKSVFKIFMINVVSIVSVVCSKYSKYSKYRL